MQQWFSESLSREMKASLTAKEEERSLFRHRGEEFARGERVSILFEDGKWYEGLLDSYSSRSSKIRVKFSNPSIGTVHVQLDQVQMRKAGRKEEEKGRQEEEEKGRREEEEGEETGNRRRREDREKGGRN
uniref:Uncharacterized protein n=1 Tax=Guillardia theta TaxID=55529 RepID=A0A7S4PQN8_GUITH|mmetsp:Transcript_9521/g.31868  ORF Transcript_9521/g.31868 Transcript_9521/m.31868 type:complete len:130 (+) Transcript_9521:301-690(+)